MSVLEGDTAPRWPGDGAGERAVVVLSVVVPVRDRPARVARLVARLDALAVAAGGRVELIVVDDGSRVPVTPPLTSSPVQLLRLPRSGGANAARRRGLDAANGVYVHFHDSDDDVDDAWFATVLPRLAPNDVDVLVTGRLEYRRDRRRVVAVPAFMARHANHPARIASRLRFQNCLGPFGGVTFRRSLLVDLRFRRLPACQDWQVYAELPWHRLHVAVLPAPLLLADQRGADRISRSARGRALAHLRLARLLATTTRERRRLRLYYLWRLARDRRLPPHRRVRGALNRARPWATLVALVIELRLVALEFSMARAPRLFGRRRTG